jgi:hypothetical protein
MTDCLTDATAAFGAAGGLWSALASDDDATAAEILSPDSRLRLSTLPGGWAERVRTVFRLRQDECRSVGLSATVRVTKSGGLLVLGVFRRPRLGIDLREESSLERSFPLVFVPIDGHWRVWGVYNPSDPELDIIGLVDVVPSAEARD